jgi:uncharacterized protein (DUF2147 family)
MKTSISLAILFIGFLYLSSYSMDPGKDEILGKWWNHEKDAHIVIYKCGNEYCGKIVWLKEPLDEDGKPKRDKNNPDESLRSRPTLGLDILSGFVFEKDRTWEDGTIYNPRDGKTYSCYLTLLDDNKLKVRGFIGISLIGKTQYWERVN